MYNSIKRLKNNLAFDYGINELKIYYLRAYKIDKNKKKE